MLEWLLFRAVSVALLIFANGFFVAAELALVSLRETRLEQLVAQGRAGARSVQRLQQHMDEFLPAVQFGVTLASLALGWIGEPAVASVVEPTFSGIPHARVYAHLIAVPIAFAAITYFHVLLGELVPKSLALQRTEQVALAVGPPMELFIKVTKPAVDVMNASARVVLRAFRMQPSGTRGTHSPEELKLLATASRRGGLLPQLEEQVIHRALELGEIEVREIMTPRQRIFSLPADLLVEEASGRIVEEEHSRVPVYDEKLGPEHIVGIVYAKDVSRLMHFRQTAQSRLSQTPFSELRLRQIMRDVLVVPESKDVSSLMVEFQQLRRHLAIVVDEYGTTTGLVTVEDALEQLVGEIEDEFDIAARPGLSLSSGAVLLDGGLNLRDLEMQLGVHLPKDEGVETLAGFLLTRFGKIPAVGEAVEFEGRRYTVAEMAGRRIAKVRMEPIAADEQIPETAE
jgi:CBS domain containing-hemolysin-like protein